MVCKPKFISRGLSVSFSSWGIFGAPIIIVTSEMPVSAKLFNCKASSSDVMVGPVVEIIILVNVQ